MNLFKKRDFTPLRYLTAHLGVTMASIEAWVSEVEEVPKIYCEEADEYADPTQFKEGDILMLAEMPFDKDGHHATGYAIWQKAAAGNYCWQNEYED